MQKPLQSGYDHDAFTARNDEHIIQRYNAKPFLKLFVWFFQWYGAFVLLLIASLYLFIAIKHALFC